MFVRGIESIRINRIYLNYSTYSITRLISVQIVTIFKQVEWGNRQKINDNLMVLDVSFQDFKRHEDSYRGIENTFFKLYSGWSIGAT